MSDHDYIPDPVELGEMATERFADEFEQPDGRWKCYVCGAIFDIRGGNSLSPDPYAPPACPKCVHESSDKNEDDRPTISGPFS